MSRVFVPCPESVPVCAFLMRLYTGARLSSNIGAYVGKRTSFERQGRAAIHQNLEEIEEKQRDVRREKKITIYTRWYGTSRGRTPCHASPQLATGHCAIFFQICSAPCVRRLASGRAKRVSKGERQKGTEDEEDSLQRSVLPVLARHAYGLTVPLASWHVGRFF